MKSQCELLWEKDKAEVPAFGEMANAELMPLKMAYGLGQARIIHLLQEFLSTAEGPELITTMLAHLGQQNLEWAKQIKIEAKLHKRSRG